MFEHIRIDTEREYLLRFSYLEIYNEQLRDLLAPHNEGLKIREDQSGIFISGLKEEIVVSPDQVVKLLEAGNSNSASLWRLSSSACTLLLA